MIVPMKKIHIFVLKKDIATALTGLRDMGNLHVEHREALDHSELQTLRDSTAVLSQTIEVLKSYQDSRSQIKQDVDPDWQKLTQKILALVSEKDRIQEAIDKGQQQIERYRPWGDFDPADIQRLNTQGVYVYFCIVPLKQKPHLPQNAVCEVVHKTGKEEFTVIISREKRNLPFETAALPPVSLKEITSSQQQRHSRLEQIEKELKEHVSHLQILEQTLSTQTEELKFKEVAVGMKKEEQLAILKGYCPNFALAHLDARAKSEQWGLMIEDPLAEDRVPTLVMNPKWVDIIRPVFQLINVLPGYKELDISFVFLIFFSIFFGILVGDAGYGLIIMGLTAFFHIKVKNKSANPAPFILFYVLSVCAIVWGVLTGTFFGTLLFGNTFKPVVAELAETKNVQLLCFMIGAIHLTIAHGWRLLMRWPAVFSALAELGWIIVLWGAFFLASVMVAGTSFLGVGLMKAMMIISTGAALVFVDIISRPKDGIGIGLALSFFSFISAFTDVVSYIRLFAVGLAGVAVADAFNQMALSFGFTSFVAGFITTLILVAGHLFNIVLCGFGILVHGLRLNVLEFSGHLGLEWAGFEYQPFKRENINPDFVPPLPACRQTGRYKIPA